jgi:hypothetical protein
MPRVRRQAGTASFSSGAELQRRGLVCERLCGQEQRAQRRVQVRQWRIWGGGQAGLRRKLRRCLSSGGGSGFRFNHVAAPGCAVFSTTWAHASFAVKRSPAENVLPCRHEKIIVSWKRLGVRALLCGHRMQPWACPLHNGSLESSRPIDLTEIGPPRDAIQSG